MSQAVVSPAISKAQPAPLEPKAATAAAPKPKARSYEKIIYPTVVALVLLGSWQALVTGLKLPAYLVPSPVMMFQTLVTDWSSLFGALLVTLKITVLSFFFATVVGVLISFLF
ncbi:MAG: Hydroxymethylpyrimidine ABC transporter, transmembrane component, partial [uncultured Ramlibacter sp.]